MARDMQEIASRLGYMMVVPMHLQDQEVFGRSARSRRQKFQRKGSDLSRVICKLQTSTGWEI